MPNKSCLRTHYKTLRQNLAGEQRSTHTKKITHHIRNLCSKSEWKNIACFASHGGEPDLSELLDFLQEMGTRPLLPRINNQKQMAIDSEMIMENKLTKIIKQGIKTGEFYLYDMTPKTIRLSASLIKSMLQDWYLKRGKYQKRRISVDQYAAHLIEMTKSHLQYQEIERISA